MSLQCSIVRLHRYIAGLHRGIVNEPKKDCKLYNLMDFGGITAKKRRTMKLSDGKVEISNDY